MTARAVEVVADSAALALVAAARVLRAAEVAVARAGAFHVALSGGSTPAALYAELARPGSPDHPLGIDFARWHVWFGDERFVPADHPESNLRMATEALLSRVPIPSENVHPVPTGAPDADSAARAYAEELASIPGRSAGPAGGVAPTVVPRFDLVLLGMGADGHTASLFPGDAALEERERWAVAVRPAGVARERITLTFPVLDAAREAIFLVAGAEKAAVLERVLAGAPELPASRVHPTGGTLTWIVDRAAAGGRLDIG